MRRSLRRWNLWSSLDLPRWYARNLSFRPRTVTHIIRQNRSLLASSLQTAHNLNVLPTLVQSLVADLTDAVEQRIRVAFDVNRISKDLAAKGAIVPAKFTHLDSSFFSAIA